MSPVDAPVDVHGRSCYFPLIHLREVLLAWALGGHQTTISLVACIITLHFSLEVSLSGVETGTSVPYMADT